VAIETISEETRQFLDRIGFSPYVRLYVAPRSDFPHGVPRPLYEVLGRLHRTQCALLESDPDLRRQVLSVYSLSSEEDAGPAVLSYLGEVAPA